MPERTSPKVWLRVTGAVQGKCAWRVWDLMKRFSQQGYASFMQLTPCDLWSLLKGRTLWVSGDSQSQASAQASFKGRAQHNVRLAVHPCCAAACVHARVLQYGCAGVARRLWPHAAGECRLWQHAAGKCS